MSDPNTRLVEALRKLGIPFENYQNHPDFLSLPTVRDEPLWNDLKNPAFDLTWFELVALKNARCPVASQPPQAGAPAADASAGEAYYPTTRVIRLSTDFPDSLGAKHPDGTIHASTIISNGDEDEKEQLKLWFQGSLAGDNYFELEKPPSDGREAVASRNFADYKGELEGLNFRVWDVRTSTGESIQILLQDARGKRRKMSGRTDFLITSSEVESRGTALPSTLCVVEIQSKNREDDCEYQLKAYLVIMMNLYGFRRLTGILVYNDGRCRAYRAERNGTNGDALYEENDTFHLYQIAEVLPTLLNF